MSGHAGAEGPPTRDLPPPRPAHQALIAQSAGSRWSSTRFSIDMLSPTWKDVSLLHGTQRAKPTAIRPGPPRHVELVVVGSVSSVASRPINLSARGHRTGQPRFGVMDAGTRATDLAAGVVVKPVGFSGRSGSPERLDVGTRRSRRQHSVSRRRETPANSTNPGARNACSAIVRTVLTALSRWRHGFESRWGCHKSPPCSTATPTRCRSTTGVLCRRMVGSECGTLGRRGCVQDRSRCCGRRRSPDPTRGHGQAVRRSGGGRR
jgi:hypothetical protein